MEPERADERFQAAVHAYWASVFDQLGWRWTYAQDFTLGAGLRVRIVGSVDPEGREFHAAARAAFADPAPGDVLLVGRQALFDDRRRRMYLGRLWRNGPAFPRIFDPASVYDDGGTIGLRQDRLALNVLGPGAYDPATCDDDFTQRFRDIQRRAKRIIWWRTPTPVPLGELLDFEK